MNAKKWDLTKTKTNSTRVESLISRHKIKIDELQSGTLIQKYCFRFTLQNFFIQISYIFNGIWRYNMEIKQIQFHYFSGTV